MEITQPHAIKTNLTTWFVSFYFVFSSAFCLAETCEKALQPSIISQLQLDGEAFKTTFGKPFEELLQELLELKKWKHLSDLTRHQEGFFKKKEIEQDSYEYFMISFIPMKTLNDYLKDKLLVDAIRNYFRLLFLKNLKTLGALESVDALFFDFKNIFFRFSKNKEASFRKAYLRTTIDYRDFTSGMRFLTLTEERKTEKFKSKIRNAKLNPERLDPHEKLFVGAFGKTPELASLTARFIRSFLKRGGSFSAIGSLKDVLHTMQENLSAIQNKIKFFKKKYPTLFQIIPQTNKTVLLLNILDFFRKRTGNWTESHVLLEQQSVFYRNFKVSLEQKEIKELLAIYERLDRFSILFLKPSPQPVQYLYGEDDALIVSYDIKKLGARNAQAILEVIQNWGTLTDVPSFLEALKENIQKRVDSTLEQTEAFLKQKNQGHKSRRSGDDIVSVIQIKDLFKKGFDEKIFKKILRSQAQKMVLEVPNNIRMTMLRPFFFKNGKRYVLTIDERSRLITELESLEKFFAHEEKTIFRNKIFIPSVLDLDSVGNLKVDIYVKSQNAELNLPETEKHTVSKALRQVFKKYSIHQKNAISLPSLSNQAVLFQFGEIHFILPISKSHHYLSETHPIILSH